MMARAILLLSCLLLFVWTIPTIVNANQQKSSTTNFSKKLNKNVEDLYDKAEKLQDRAFQRVYELQAKAQELQDRALQRSQQLEQQSQAILEKATLQARQLQQQASRNLGELQSAIEGLPLPSVEKHDDDDDDDALLDAQVEINLGNELDVDMSVTEMTTTSSSQQQVVVPNKWHNVKQRTVPAILMLASLAAYIHLGGSFIPLVFMIQLGLFAETTAVANIRNIGKWWWFVTAVAATNGHFLGWKHVNAIAYGMSVMGIVVWVICQNANKGENSVMLFQSHLATLAATALALLILVGQSSFWIATLQDHGLTWILYPAFLVIINDTMAYVFGMLLGKHPLLPVISPKKTWEGFLGATVSTLAVSYPLLEKMAPSISNDNMYNWRHALAIGTFVSLISPFGGFLASIVKRAHNQKDFATWIPGHGGVVDRLDCQVFTAPFVYYYLSTFQKAPAV